MVACVPSKSRNGSATLTSDAEEGQAGRGRSSARATAATVRTAAGVAGAAQLACALEVSAEKPGNITPSHDFRDTSYEDMLGSAIAVGPELGRAGERGVGETVRAVVEASRRVAPANTNLGIALLLAPLAKAALSMDPPVPAAPRHRGSRPDAGVPLRRQLGSTLRALDVADAYAAIRVSGAGGLHERVEHDVRSEPTIGLREAMASAAERDSIASEYVTDYALTFETGIPALAAALGDGLAVREAIVELHLRLLDEAPDSLVARKRGADAAARVSAGAREVLAAGGVRTEGGRRALRRFDASLREPGNALNPGTTADLVTATVFVALLEGMLSRRRTA
jgi:triphosphoribosyl-dephospho-CoA synthase